LATIRALLKEASIGARISAGLPLPMTNRQIEGDEVDCVWAKERLIVELDGRATHDTSHAFERDRERDRALAAAGWRVIRITWRQLHEEPHLVEADLRRLLGQPASRTV
jgi:very-short-patch-repair endonuclease